MLFSICFRCLKLISSLWLSVGSWWWWAGLMIEPIGASCYSLEKLLSKQIILLLWRLALGSWCRSVCACALFVIRSSVSCGLFGCFLLVSCFAVWRRTLLAIATPLKVLDSLPFAMPSLRTSRASWVGGLSYVIPLGNFLESSASHECFITLDAWIITLRGLECLILAIYLVISLNSSCARMHLHLSNAFIEALNNWK